MENAYLTQDDIIFLGTLLQQTKSKNVLTAYSKILIEARKKGVKDKAQKVLHNEELDTTQTSMSTFSIAGSTLLSQGFISIDNIPNQQRDYFRLDNEQKQAALLCMTAIKEGIFNLEQTNQILLKWSNEYEKTHCQILRYLLHNRYIESKMLEHVFSKIGTIQEGLGRVTLKNGILQIGASVPKNFGRYQIEEEIARGGMGIVYKAYDPSFQRRVALKVLIRGGNSSQLDVARFEREARSVYKIQHENIIPIYDLGTENGMPYFAMHFVEGQSLDKQKLPIPYKKAIKILSPIGNALYAAHQNEIIHRDIKPANIMIDNVGKVWLTDFGLAKDKAGVQELTQAGSFMGTPAYMAPEQIDYPESADAKCDIYSLGVVFYLLIVGKTPYEANTFPALLRKIAEGQAKAPHVVCKDIPENISRICMRAIAKKKKDRYGSAQRLIKDLENAMQQKSSRTLRINSSNIRKKGHNKKKSVNYTKMFIVAPIILTLLLFAMIMFSGNDKEENEKIKKKNIKIKALKEKLLKEKSLKEKLLKDKLLKDKLKREKEEEEEEKVRKRTEELSQKDINVVLSGIRDLITKKEYILANEEIDILKKLYPNNSAIYYQKSRIFTIQKKYLKALEFVNKSITLNKTSQYLGHKGLIYRHMKNYEKSIVEYTKSVTLSNCLHCREERAFLHVNLQQHNAAIDDFSKLLEKKGKRTYIAAIGQCFVKLGTPKIALKFFNNYIENFPQKVPKALLGHAYNERAMIFDLDLDRAKKARKDYRVAIKIIPEYAGITDMLAKTYLKKHKFEKTLSILKNTMKRLPTYYGSYEVRGDCYIEMNKKQMAVKQWEKALDLLLKNEFFAPKKLRDAIENRIKSKLNRFK